MTYYRRFPALKAQLLQLGRGLAAQFPDGSLQHDIEVFADNPRALLPKVEGSFNAHCVQLLADAPSDAPYVLYRHDSEQSTLAVDIGQVHYSARLPLPFFGGMVCELCQCFGLSNANPDS